MRWIEMSYQALYRNTIMKESEKLQAAHINRDK